MSATGPGKPYWKRPVGSTGPATAGFMKGSGREGTDAGGVRRDGGPAMVVVVDVMVVVGEDLGRLE